MTLKLYGVLKSRASRVVWMLNELGQSFEHVPVIQAYRLADPAAPDARFNTASRAFRAINPNGLIPSLEDDGLVLHESLAITLYLARKFGGPITAQSLAEDGQILQWTLWAAATCELHCTPIVMHLQKSSDLEPVRPSIEALRGPFDVLEAALAESGGWLVGGRFTVADLNLAEVLRYAQPARELFDDHPRVDAWIEACQARPAFQAMWAARETETV
ncbi:glutathione S-transferase [Caulobacter ginsengisoli]|uniref:Glutathione S-transferase n=1 Tax=Caulobacter ginsengisoli TaxID=400775 RepID=A0ABU0IP50_9CAUL|nr:glutathione S-transferase family protein [Caulobacter ginsengisoli]MDQ0463171.1 glutathione S-transferase [Caulobacter ginsengisoli]